MTFKCYLFSILIKRNQNRKELPGFYVYRWVFIKSRNKELESSHLLEAASCEQSKKTEISIFLETQIDYR